MAKQSTPNPIAICTQSLPNGTPGVIQLFPAGEFRAWDGRPTDVAAWRIDAAIAASVIAAFNARKSRIVVDYEHQTLLAKDNGQPAPAAGWITGLEWREGEGLFGTVDWTARAAAMIEAGEYAYISPVFPFDQQTGAVQAVVQAALTNFPALDGMAPAMLAAASALFNPTENKPMNDELMERLCYLLNLPLTTTPAEMAGELDKLKTMIQGQPAMAATKLGLGDYVASLTAQIPDPAKFVPLTQFEALKAEFNTLKTASLTRDIEDLVGPALADGRLLPAQEPWARELGKTNFAALKQYVETAEPFTHLRTGQTGNQPPAGAKGGGADGQTLEARCKAEWEGSAALRAEFGDNLSTYIAYKGAEAAGSIKTLGSKE
jgi:phage I-like protein